MSTVKPLGPIGGRWPRYTITVVLLIASVAASAVALRPRPPVTLAEQLQQALTRGDVSGALDMAIQERLHSDPAAAAALYSWLNMQPHGRLDDVLRTKLHVAAALLDPSMRRVYEDILNDASFLVEIDSQLLHRVYRAWESAWFQDPELMPVGPLLELFMYPPCPHELLGEWERADEDAGVRIAALDRDTVFYYVVGGSVQRLGALWYAQPTSDPAKPSLLGDFPAEAVISPDRQKLASCDGPRASMAPGELGQLTVWDIGSGQTAEITLVARQRGNLAWSRDSRRLAVDTEQGIVLVDVLTGDSSLVLPCEIPLEADGGLGLPLYLHIVGWSPDHHEVLYQRSGYEGSGPVEAVSVDDGSVREVLGPGPAFQTLSGAEMSPDGHWMLCARIRDWGGPWYSDLMVIPTGPDSQAQPRVLTSGALAAWPVSWSVDGGYIVFRLYTGGVEQTHILNLTTGARARLGDALFVLQYNQAFLTDDGTAFHVPWLRGRTLAKVRLTLP